MLYLKNGFFTIIFAFLWSISDGISITNNGQPKDSINNSPIGGTSSEITTLKPINTVNSTLEKRPKRLLYSNNFAQNINDYNNYGTPDFYRNPQNSKSAKQQRVLYYVPKNEKPLFTLDNALPGSFTPIRNQNDNGEIRYFLQQQKEVPNFNDIYHKLWELKSKNQQQQRLKTFIRTYTPTNIDVDDSDAPRPHGHGNLKIILEVPTRTFIQPPQRPQNNPNPQIIYLNKQNRPIPVGYEKKPKPKPNHYQRIVVPLKQQVVHENFVAQNWKPQYRPHHQNYEYLVATPSPISTTIKPPSSSSSSFSKNDLEEILVKLQHSNALPQGLTVENVDNSIKTLMKILNSLKKRNEVKKIVKPIIVADEYYDENSSSSEEDHSTPPPHYAHTPEGGTPGIPGVDYPALSSIPHTDFDCKTQRYKGFFGDPDTNCQVWHYCDLNGGQASFLCPNGTIFSQVALTCDWWFNVKCSSTPQLYVLNERLYKYILPFAPKFPEDYSGPLVDKYLAMKFMEMEEKMKSERKGKEDAVETTTSTEDESEENTTIVPTNNEYE